MEFVLNGVRHTVDARAVRAAVRGLTPDDVREHWVDVDGVHWPPKQVFALTTACRAPSSPHTSRCGSSGVSAPDERLGAS
nr:hypothetical protein [Actinomycetota bacterium]